MDADNSAAPPAAEKQDPQAFVLRGRPRAAIRFRRGVIMGVTGAVCACVIAVTWLALEPSGLRIAAGDAAAEPMRKAAPDALAGAPATYGEVPRLGPPLPGDLGRPILDHQRSLEEAPADPPVAPSGAEEQQRAAAEAERQRIAAAAAAARASGVLVQLSGTTGGGQNEAAPPAAPAVPATSADAVGAPPVGGARMRPSPPGEASPARIVPAPSPWTLSAGTTIAASLITGLNSDLPGLVVAQVTEHVRDSATGQTVLIPQGARLVGSYDSVVAFGQRRALLVWQRIVLPDGSSVALDNLPATDAAGYAGVEDRVDFHTWRLLKGILLSSLLGVGSELGLGSSESDLVRAIRETTQQNAARGGEQITQRNLDVQPTLRVRPGTPVRAVMHRDLVLRPWSP